jgi:hypothetical protein
MTMTGKILKTYYAATALFLVLDYGFGISVRATFLDGLPVAKAAYYGACLACLALMAWRPAWTPAIATVESLVVLVALILSMGLRTLIVTDQMIETGAGVPTLRELLNFMIAGSIAWIGWQQGLRALARGRLSG